MGKEGGDRISPVFYYQMVKVHPERNDVFHISILCHLSYSWMLKNSSAVNWCVIGIYILCLFMNAEHLF